MSTEISTRLSRLRRWLLRITVVLACACLLGSGAVWLLIHNLGRPALKRRIVAAAASSGIGLDFDEAAASFGSVHLSGLRIAQPRPNQSLAPLVLIDRIDARFSIWGLLVGGRFRLESGEIRGIHLTVFADADGTSSLSRLAAQLPKTTEKKKEKPEALSKTLASLARLKVAIDDFQIGEVEAVQIERSEGKEIGRATFTGLSLAASDLKGALKLVLSTPESGARLEVIDDGGKRGLIADGRFQFDWSARGEEPLGELGAHLTLREQGFFKLPPKAPPIREVLRFRGSVLPQPEKQETTVAITELSMLDGAATGTLDADLADDGAGLVKPAIREARFELALKPLRLFVPPEAGELPLLEGAVKLKVLGVDLTHGLRIAKDGTAELHAELERLSWRKAERSAEIIGARIDLHARPSGDGFALELKAPLDSVRAAVAGRTIALDHAQLSGSGQVSRALHASGQLTATLQTLHVAGPQALDSTAAELHLGLKDADLTAEGPLRISGGVASEASFEQLAARADGLSLEATGLRFRAPLELKASGSGAGEVHLEAGMLGVTRSGRALLAPTSLSADLRLARFSYDAEDAARSTADATLELALGDSKAQLHLDKRARGLDYQLDANATTLVQVRPFVDSAQAQIPWQQIGLGLSSKGKVEHLGEGNSLEIEDETTLQLAHFAAHNDDIDVGAAQLEASLRSRGTMQRHEVTVAMHLTGLTIQGEARPGDESLQLHAQLDRAKPEVALQFEAKGAACPEGKLALAAGYERSTRRVSYALDGELHQLDLIPTLVPPKLLANAQLDWSTLAFAIHGKGIIDGLVTSMRELKPQLSAAPLQTVRGAQTLELTLSGLDYSNDADQALALASAALHLDAQETADSKHLELTANSPQGELSASGVDAKYTGLAGALTVDLGSDTLRAQAHLGFGSLKQDAQPAYPIGDASFDLLATAEPDGALHFESKLDNLAAGTTLTASGAIESLLKFSEGVPKLVPIATGQAGEARDLHLAGDLTQRLVSLPAGVGVSGQGMVKVPFTIDSSDFRFFHLTTGLEFQDADLDFTGRKFALKKLNAKIPIKLSFRLDDKGTLPLGGARAGIYSRERFVDYQPLLNQEDFVTCESMQVGESTLGPLAGNLRIDRNLIALDQLEISAFGGTITGQLILDLDLAQRQLTDVQFRGDVTGLAPGRGEERSSDVVDANAALRLDPKKLELEGRIDIIRIGRDDLSAMLDAWDPYHADSSANRTRKALAVGYPKHVRMSFHQGFTQIELEMGGIAGAASIAPMQLSTGPVLEKYAAPYLNAVKPKAKPKPLADPTPASKGAP